MSFTIGSKMKLSKINIFFAYCFGFRYDAPAKVNAILDQTIGLGEPFALKCSATGYPLPKVEWQILKDGKFVKLTSQVYNGTAESVYKVSTASTTDRGKYKCVADNGATKDNKPAPDSKEIEVLIYTKPSITSATDEVKFILGKGEKKTIACVAEGFPAPKITFSKDGKNITTGVNKTTDKQSVTGTLVYTVTKKEDFGEIVCTAKNERGEQTRTIKVSEIKKPGMPTELEAVLVDVTEVTIAWKAPIKTGEEKITLYEITIAPVNGTASTEKTTGTRVKLDGLKRKTKYSISVRAKNVAGLGKPSTINVVTEEFALPGSPTVDKFSKDIPPHEIPISWSKPTEDGGSPSLTYKVAVCVYDQVKKTPSDCYTINAGSNTSVIIKNVKPDTYYSITVNAVNSRGRGKSVSVVTRTGKSMATPKPAPKEPRKEERGLGGGAIAGIVIAVILIVLIVVDLFCCFFNNCGFTHCCYETFCAGKAGKAAKYEAAKSEEKQELKEKDNAPAENV